MHNHAHGHGHSHGTVDATAPDNRRRIGIALGLTSVIVLAQFVGAVITGSLALFTDTMHALVDASGLAVALLAAHLILKPPSAKRTWGFRRVEVLAALAQASILLVVGIFAAIEGIRRLFAPPEVSGPQLLIFGVIGLLANLTALLMLSRDRNSNLNMRAAFLEVFSDALGSVGVIIGALAIHFTGFLQADALVTLFIVAMIVPRAIFLMRETLGVLMEFTPPGLDLDEVRSHLLGVEHVKEVHDLHASTVATGLPVLTAHLVVEDQCFTDGHAADILSHVKHCVAEHFEVSVEHSTFQIEPAGVAERESSTIRHD